MTIVDMNASEFGLCKCGFKKIDHGKPREMFMTKKDAPDVPAPRAPPAPVAAPAPPPPPVHEPVKTPERRTSEQPCNHFEIDVTGTFGFCKCWAFA
jgi:hypothetical protein